VKSPFSGSGLVFLGWALEYSYLAAGTALVLRYARPRLADVERSIVAALIVLAMGLRLPAFFLSGTLPDGLHARFPFRRAYAPIFHDWFLVGGQRVGSATLLILTALLVIRRFRLTGGIRRQSTLFLAAVAVAISLFAAADQLTWVWGISSESWVPAMGRNLFSAILPVAIVIDLLRRRTAAALVGERVMHSASQSDLNGLQTALRDTLADPTLLVTMSLEDERLVGVDGRALTDLNGYVMAPVTTAQGRSLCTVAYDARAVDDPELLEAALQATRLGLENTRLNAEAIAHVAELQDAQTRIIDAGIVERRRIERDLHDGAQQRFLAVAAQLTVAKLAHDPGEMRRMLDEACTQLRDALAELRGLARGIHPPTLTQAGLGPALEAVAEISPIPVSLNLERSIKAARFHQTIEASAYFVVAEAVANAAKHSQGTRITVGGSVSGGTLCVTVVDDGVGGGTFRPGGGLEGLRDRVVAVGGTLVVEQGPTGTGTLVRASLPLRSTVN
jgi:signal transduction histidine kinase